MSDYVNQLKNEMSQIKQEIAILENKPSLTHQEEKN
jgi:hypothetical protein